MTNHFFKCLLNGIYINSIKNGEFYLIGFKKLEFIFVDAFPLNFRRKRTVLLTKTMQQLYSLK